VIDLAIAITLLLSVALLCVRRFGTALLICAAQALFAACVLGRTIAPAAVLAVAFNGIALPLVLARLAGSDPLDQRVSGMFAWGVVAVTAVAALALFGGLGAGRFAAGAAVVLLGLLLSPMRQHALATAVGLLSSQNGLVLVAGTRPDLRLLAAIVVAIPISPALALAARWLPR
jgi:hypothetical protein